MGSRHFMAFYLNRVEIQSVHGGFISIYLSTLKCCITYFLNHQLIGSQKLLPPAYSLIFDQYCCNMASSQQHSAHSERRKLGAILDFCESCNDFNFPVIRVCFCYLLLYFLLVTEKFTVPPVWFIFFHEGT